MWVNRPPVNLVLKFPNYKHLKIFSPSMDRETGCSLFLPEGYAQYRSKRFPVIYMLHGGYGNETTCPGLTYATFHRIMTELKRPAIVVYPNGGAMSDFCDLKTSTGRGETSVIKEVLPYIDSHYRTLTDRTHRAVIGYSAGCYGAQKFFFKYPELFSVCIGFGGGAHNYDVTMDSFIRKGLKIKFDNDPQYLRENNVYRFIALNKSRIQSHPYYIKLICGEKDPRMNNVNYFKSYLQRYGYRIDVSMLKGIGHSLEKLWNRSGDVVARIILNRIGAISG